MEEILAEPGGGVPMGLFRKGSAFIVCMEICCKLSIKPGGGGREIEKEKEMSVTQRTVITRRSLNSQLTDWYSKSDDCSRAFDLLIGL